MNSILIDESNISASLSIYRLWHQSLSLNNMEQMIENRHDCTWLQYSLLTLRLSTVTIYKWNICSKFIYKCWNDDKLHGCGIETNMKEKPWEFSNNHLQAQMKILSLWRYEVLPLQSFPSSNSWNLHCCRVEICNLVKTHHELLHGSPGQAHSTQILFPLFILPSTCSVGKA